MFRKLTHIIISLLLLTTTVGFSISKHYCGVNLVSTTVNHEAKSCCDLDSGCCHNETTFYNLDNDFVYSTFIDNSTITQIDLLFPLFYVIIENISSKKIETFKIYESPPPLKIQVVLSNLQTYRC
jgi:hypothetical protein